MPLILAQAHLAPKIGALCIGGDNETAAPNTAPDVLSIRADGTDLIVTINDYAPGQDGWSGITSYAVTCGQASTVTSSTQRIIIEGLQSDTAYECTVIATNALGASPRNRGS